MLGIVDLLTILNSGAEFVLGDRCHLEDYEQATAIVTGRTMFRMNSKPGAVEIRCLHLVSISVHQIRIRGIPRRFCVHIDSKTWII